MKEISGGVCAPKGFKAGGIRCGIKASATKRDLAIICSEKPCSAAGVFTVNKARSACVTVSKEHIKDGALQAVIINSGNANACTGEAGVAAAKKMASLGAELLKIDPHQVAVASTGVIGVPLPIEKIEQGLKEQGLPLTDNEEGFLQALEAIMTTDTTKKYAAFELEIDGKKVRLGGMTKGSGMIHPNLATMLCFITTDAAVSPQALDTCLRRAAQRSFNRLSVDGDTSTNDMAIVMANGEAGNSIITEGSGGYEAFAQALETLCIRLAREIARDGEGATKLITVTVSGARDEKTAEILAKSVVSSSLVKAACFGADANWGRILCAMGYSGADFDPEKVDVSFVSVLEGEEVMVCKDGSALEFSEDDARRILGCKELEIRIKAGTGQGNSEAWCCDLTYDYVKINGDYRS